MGGDNRKFAGSICVRLDTGNTRIELSPAELYGGESGLYRLRVRRRWVNHEDGSLLFFDRAGLAEVAASLAFGALPDMPPEPDLPRGTRVSATYWYKDMPHTEGVYTSTPPIRGHDGKWRVGVMTFNGFFFVPVEDVTVRRRHE